MEGDEKSLDIPHEDPYKLPIEVELLCKEDLLVDDAAYAEESFIKEKNMIKAVNGRYTCCCASTDSSYRMNI